MADGDLQTEEAVVCAKCGTNEHACPLLCLEGCISLPTSLLYLLLSSSFLCPFTHELTSVLHCPSPSSTALVTLTISWSLLQVQLNTHFTESSLVFTDLTRLEMCARWSRNIIPAAGTFAYVVLAFIALLLSITPPIEASVIGRQGRSIEGSMRGGGMVIFLPQVGNIQLISVTNELFFLVHSDPIYWVDMSRIHRL